MNLFKAEDRKNIAARWRAFIADEEAVSSLIRGFLFLFLVLIVNYFAALYALEHASGSVSDIVLSNIPTFDVDAFFIVGPFIFWAALAWYVFTDPKKIAFPLKSVALFVIIRSFFISLTHIGPFPDQTPLDIFGSHWMTSILHIDPTFSFIFSSGYDLFFSAHTGLPFLMALLFWKNKRIRIFCLAASIFFGIIVLLGHLHYSIDVASAFFITYTISVIAGHAFKQDQQRFLS